MNILSNKLLFLLTFISERTNLAICWQEAILTMLGSDRLCRYWEFCTVYTQCVGCYLKWKPHCYDWPWEDILWEQWVVKLLLVILPSWDALWSCMCPNRCTFVPSAYLKFSQHNVKSFCVARLWVCVDGISLTSVSDAIWDQLEFDHNFHPSDLHLTCFKWILHFHRLICECKTCLMRKKKKKKWIILLRASNT